MKKIYVIFCLATCAIQAKIIEIDGQQQLDDILKKNEPVVIKFYRPGCPACRSIEHDFNTIANKINKNRKQEITFLAINTDKEKNKAVYPKWNVTGVPALFFVKQGQKKSVPRKKNFPTSFEQDINQHFLKQPIKKRS